MRHRRRFSTRFHADRMLYLLPDRRVARAGHVPEGRALHLVDIENLVGGTVSARMDVNCALATYRRLAAVGPGDHVIIGAGPTLLPTAGQACRGARSVLGRGIDGADQALLSELRDVAWVATHYDRVVLGSGDGIFADALAAVRACGIAVGVVALSDQISWRLRRSADFVCGFSPEFDVQGAA